MKNFDSNARITKGDFYAAIIGVCLLALLIIGTLNTNRGGIILVWIAFIIGYPLLNKLYHSKTK